MRFSKGRPGRIESVSVGCNGFGGLSIVEKLIAVAPVIV